MSQCATQLYIKQRPSNLLPLCTPKTLYQLIMFSPLHIVIIRQGENEIAGPAKQIQKVDRIIKYRNVLPSTLKLFIDPIFFISISLSILMAVPYRKANTMLQYLIILTGLAMLYCLALLLRLFRKIMGL